MNPLIWGVLKKYAPIITLPFAVVIGTIGYTIEHYLREKKTITTESFSEKRAERRLNELIDDPMKDLSLKDFHYSKNKVLNREENISPSLSK